MDSKLVLPARVVERARIVLLAAEDRQDMQIVAAMKITPKQVSRSRSRFLDLGMAGAGTGCVPGLPARESAELSALPDKECCSNWRNHKIPGIAHCLRRN
jgi:hypothetical protein